MSRKDKDKRTLDFRTEREAGQFLFSMEGMTSSKAMDMRTRIESESTMKMLTFYSLLGYCLKCDSALEIKDTVERILIARKGLGRLEGVTVLRQNFPKIREVSKGSDYLDYEKEALDSIEE